MPEIVTRAEAKARGLTRYFTGKPCKRGHVAERLASSRKCFECSRANCKARYEANPDRGRARAKAWHGANLDRARSRDKARYAADPDKAKADRKARREANADREKAYAKEWRGANAKSILARNAARRARVRGLLGAASPDIRERLRKLQGGKCACCRVSLRKAGEHLDHIKPLARGGLHEDANLQLLCPPCNLSKGAKCPVEHAREMGRLL